MCEETKAPRKVKIEGEAFNRIKSKSDAFDQLKNEVKSQLNASHKDFWDAIYAECPDFSRDDSLELDKSHEDIGVYIVSEKQRCGSLSDLLRSLTKIADPE